MKIDISKEEFGALCICAIRYCHGRQTYAPSMIRSIVESYLDELSDNTIYVMLNDCDFQERFDLYGDEKIDKPGWVEWRRMLQSYAAGRGIG